MTIQKLIEAVINNNLDKVKELVKTVDLNSLDDSTFVNPKDGHIAERTIKWCAVDLALILKRDEISNFLLKSGAKVKSSVGLQDYHLRIINN